MGFDRNTIIGFVLLAVLFFGYFLYTSSNQKKYAAEKKRYDDSIKAITAKNIDTSRQKKEVEILQKAQDTLAAGNFKQLVNGTEQFTVIENDLMKATFTNKGGWLKMVELKKYKDPNGLPVKMGGTNADLFQYSINTGNNESISTNKLFFNTPKISKTSNQQTISYQITSSDGKAIVHSFTIKPNDYLIDANIGLDKADQLLSQQSLNVLWSVVAQQQQKDLKYEKTQTKLVYYTNNEYDYNSAPNSISEQLKNNTQWIGLKQQFFNSTLISKNNFSNIQADVIVPDDSIQQVGTLKTSARLLVNAGTSVQIPLQMYYGPNEYKLLKGYENGMHNIVDLGSGIFSFVKYINRAVIMPVFGFLAKIMSGKLGWAILLLTFFIRLLISPLTYTSYVSGAKMKVLQPDLKALKEKLGNDQQAYSMEQMKLFKEAGVNPLGGCIPALLQIPIFFALYAFFNSNIALRGQSFLWANDLSMYDAIVHFSFSIPLYGDHISLFTITACLTSFLISLYGMSATPDQSNPMMKYMPYVFPFMMLFFFNKLPSALTWYYTVSNVITLAIQFVINKYIIDHDKILAKIALNRSKPKTKSKWQQRLEEIQESQKKVQELKNKTIKK